VSSTPYVGLELFIDGSRLGARGRQTEEIVNPATGERIGILPHATPDES